jgi:hypothetical protein
MSTLKELFVLKCNALVMSSYVLATKLQLWNKISLGRKRSSFGNPFSCEEQRLLALEIMIVLSTLHNLVF